VCRPGLAEMVFGDRLTQRPRAAVEHQPELSLVVGLELKEVIAPAERSELHAAVPTLELLQRRMANGGNRAVQPGHEARQRRTTAGASESVMRPPPLGRRREKSAPAPACDGAPPPLPCASARKLDGGIRGPGQGPRSEPTAQATP